MSTPEWCQDVIAIKDIIPDRAERQASGESVPSWVERIDEELERRNFPVRVEPGDEVDPRKAGQLIGQRYAYYGWILDCLRRPNGALIDKFRKDLQETAGDIYDD